MPKTPFREGITTITRHAPVMVVLSLLAAVPAACGPGVEGTTVVPVAPTAPTGIPTPAESAAEIGGGSGHIAFVSDRDEPDPENCRDDCNTEIYVMDVSGGSEPVRLTDHPARDTSPAWSPDGTQIAFASLRDNPPPENGLCMLFCAYELYILGVSDSSGPARLTDTLGEWPSWSPDGTRIAFMAPRDVEYNYDIFVVAIDGSGTVRLTENAVYDGEPAWSPDGKRIVFVSERDGSRDIYTMNADGSEPVRLTDHPKYDGSPAWSPDGSRIAFMTYRDGSPEIYVVNADGSEPTNLTNHPAWDGFPAWSLDGMWIAFVSDRDGNGEIYVMAFPDSSNLIRLTDHPAGDGYPAWQP